MMIVKCFNKGRKLVKKPNLVLESNPVKIISLAYIVKDEFIKRRGYRDGHFIQDINDIFVP
jgi:hypothetical protein